MVITDAKEHERVSHLKEANQIERTHDTRASDSDEGNR